ncbi:hypothetical protein SAMN06265380_12131, partial [Ruegeria faecimaris]
RVKRDPVLARVLSDLNRMRKKRINWLTSNGSRRSFAVAKSLYWDQYQRCCKSNI